MFRTCGRILVRCPVSFHLYIFFPPGQVELIARSKFQSLSKLDAFSRFKINTEERNRAKAGKQKKAIILGRGGGKGWVESHGTMNLFRRGGPIPRDYTPGHASFLRCVRKRLEGRHLTEQGMAIVRYIREETTQVGRTFFRVATLPDNPVCFLSSLCPVDCGGGLWSSARSTGKMKIPVCAGLHYARPAACSATPNVGKRVKMTLVSAILCVFFLFFYDVPRRDSIFLRCCISRACICVCVCVCARGPVFRDEETPKRGLVSLWESRYNKAYRTKYFSFFFRPLLRVGILRYFGVLK